MDMPGVKLSLTEFIRPLGAAGLIRPAGERAMRNTPATLWEVVPPAEVEKAARKWAERGEQTTARKRADLRARRTLKPGGYSEFYTTRDRTLELTMLLQRIEEMIFWEPAEPEDLAEIYESVHKQHGWCQRVMDAVDLRRADDETRAKIEKLQAMTQANGASAGEEANARAAIRRQERKLD
jgi:hypothetical protein